MKLKIKEINQNPFKKEINKGKLNEENVLKLMSNMKELGLMGSVPVFKKDGKYHQLSHHHRTEALKRTFGNDYQVEVTLHEYSDENVLRGMVIENLTQRSDELVEVTENLGAVRKYLKEHDCSADEQSSKQLDSLGRENRQPEPGSITQIAEWLNQQGEVMSRGKIHEYLKVHDNLDKRLLNRAVRTEGGVKEEERDLSIAEAKTLARLNKKDQFEIKKILDETGVDNKEKAKLVTSYKESTDELREKVKQGDLDIKDIQYETAKQDVEELIENRKPKDKTDQDKIKEFLGYLRMSMVDTESNTKQIVKHIAILSRYTDSMDEKQKSRLNNELKKLEGFFGKVQDLMSKIRIRI